MEDRQTLQISLPRKLDIGGVLRFAKDLQGAGYYRKVSLDVGEERYFAPFSMLFLGSILRKYCAENPECRLFVKNFAAHSYANHMGFFKHFGLESNAEHRASEVGKTYIPIRMIKRSDLYSAPDDRFVEMQDLVQRQADILAEIICQDKEKHKDLYDVLSYGIREVFRNVFEHSKADDLSFCAQMWKSSEKVEICIADLGIGIRKGLGENPNFRYKSDKEAIEYSLLPTVSGKTHLPRRSSTWFNSGYGLYMTSRLARHGGNFVIVSGTSGMKFTAKTKENYETWFPGTALRLNFDTRLIGNVQKRLAEFRDDGAKIAKQLAGSAGRPPSAMSLLLRRDFH